MQATDYVMLEDLIEQGSSLEEAIQRGIPLRFIRVSMEAIQDNIVRSEHYASYKLKWCPLTMMGSLYREDETDTKDTNDWRAILSPKTTDKYLMLGRIPAWERGEIADWRKDEDNQS